MEDIRMTSALVVDDHPLFCDALAITLRSVAGIRDIRTAATLQGALDELGANGTPDVVVLDLNLPDVRGLDGLVRLRNIAGVPVVVVSSMAEDRLISSALSAGAAGYIPKHSQRDVFRAAFDSLRRGQRFVPEGYLGSIEDDGLSRDDTLARIATLTNQQARILDLITNGKLNKQIAYELSIAETTVKAHVTAIMRKLGVHSRTQAALLASEASFSNVLRREG
ncbi:DNA-binding response regulator [Pseudooceanicola sediminis]|uniref:DNA-binding response regulator n=1 Tax=Pseudooceanicola sediminis TaxID=2211117 RepID=A0A399J3T3_9RHOB|nr:response regulator transcription factor [Pseudooceanicola sediminis]KAA2312984.1 response regulator transcription factor [Puniceibacterium sp. HSS470]RII37616.1 DNA-binding response regulator [Pseudooceanicola sediminis]|tara:strand:- start:16956 stop:17624 length:669 start_codon:yes stop_codon:yes gene_type:complete